MQENEWLYWTNVEYDMRTRERPQCSGQSEERRIGETEADDPLW